MTDPTVGVEAVIKRWRLRQGNRIRSGRDISWPFYLFTRLESWWLEHIRHVDPGTGRPITRRDQ